MIEARDLVKRYGHVTAVDDLSFQVRPGRVTGFLGPNGSGKSTTLRMVLGLDRPDHGEVTVNGRRYADRAFPLHEVGGLLEAKAMHPSRTAYDHLRWLAVSNRIPARRIDEVIGITGLSAVAGRRTRGFSLGMSQRLGVAAALLADPPVLLLDEPVNGLDPEGIRWIRMLLRRLADEGRTVFVSSHLMSEMSLTADHVLVVGRGRLIADLTMAELLDSASATLRLVTPDAAGLVPLLEADGATVVDTGDGALHVSGRSGADVGELARRHGLAIYELAPSGAALEEAFMALTSDAVEFSGNAAAGASR